MNTSFWTTISRYIRNARQWYEATPERSLDQAYDAALMIKAIEDEHFEGHKISPHSARYSENTNAFFQAELRKYLKITEIRLSEFKASRFIFNSTDPSASARPGVSAALDKEHSFVILEKLKFIDEVLDRYRPKDESLSLVPITPSNPSAVVRSELPINSQIEELDPLDNIPKGGDGVLDKTGALPRSIAGTLNRIRQDLDPGSEQKVVQNFRNAKAKTLISIRFILLLIIIPLLTQQLSKALIVGPIVDHFRSPEQVFINFELEEEALRELQTYKEKLEFQNLLRPAPAVAAESPVKQPAEKPVGEAPAARRTAEQPSEPRVSAEEEISIKLREKAEEIKRDYSDKSADAIKNWFADIFSIGAFAIVIMTNRREIAILKSFIDETVYGLSDSAKAFIIILFTDIFVGFHSPHGWEVLLDGLSKHLGLPANHDFIFLFIATFPVILDTIFKYWIFRYLNRISPSAVATYRNMNE